MHVAGEIMNQNGDILEITKWYGGGMHNLSNRIPNFLIPLGIIDGEARKID
jgi:hypothetical protein